MKKRFTYVALTAILVGSCSLALAFARQQSDTPLAFAPAASNSPDKVFYGVLEYSDEWISGNNHTLKTGVYSTTFDNDSPFKAESSVGSGAFASHGGMYVDGYLYYLNGEVTSSRFSMTFNKMNVDTWTVEDMSAHYNNSDVARAMAYDYTTSTTYAVGPIYVGSNNALAGYRLSAVDLSTGNFTEVTPLSRKYTGLACDKYGQLWGISHNDKYPYSPSLYKIDKSTGAETVVGPLGVNQKSETCGTDFDLSTGKLYWSARTFEFNESYEETYKTALYEIDTTTGAATIVKEYRNSELVSVLFFLNSNPNGPDAVEKLKFNYEPNSLTAGHLSMTLPTNTFSGVSISGKLSLEVSVDGVTVAQASGLAPGSSWQSGVLTFDEGSHNVDVVCTDDSGIRGRRERLVVYSGFDVPAAVGNLSVTTDVADAVATVTWDAPSEGKNGGYIDASALTYTVRRRPDNKIVASGLTDLKFVDEIDRNMGPTQYAVTPVLDGNAGAETNTPIIVAGKPHPLPYLETFDSNTSFMSYIAIDANNDAMSDGNYWMYYSTYREAVWWMSYSFYSRADDWLIAPAVDINSSRVYKLQFETHGYSSTTDAVTTFEVFAGEQPTLESMTTKLLSRSVPSTYEPTTIQGMFIVPDGARRLGFHLTNEGKAHAALDNIHVSDYGPLTIAAAPEVTKIEKSNAGVKLTVTVPALTAAGKPLSSISNLYLYGNNKRVAQKLANPVIGSTVVLTDPNPDRSINNYVVVAENADGMGIESYAAINVVPGAPKSVEDVSVGSTGSSAVVRWSYPADMLDADGGKLSESDISFNVYVDSDVFTGISGTEFIDDNALQRLGGRAQGKLTYYVEAVTEGGTSRKVNGSGIVGEALELPYDQTFVAYDGLWTGSNFQCVTSSYDPMIREGKDDSGFITFFGSRTSSGMSPRVNLSTLMSPKLSFWVYKTSQTKFKNSTFTVGVEVVDDDGFPKPVKYLTTPESIEAETDGWVYREVDLSAYATATRASVVFTIQNVSGRVHIDNVAITGTQATNDMRLRSFTGPVRCVTGRANTYTATVENKGLHRASDFKVEFLVDGKVESTQTSSLDPDQEQDIEFAYTPSINHPEVEKVITARVTSVEEDFNVNNNERSLTVNVYYPDVPLISTLSAEQAAEGVSLSWLDPDSYPHSISVLDDVETYPVNTITNPGSWVTVDRDGTPTLSGISSSAGSYTWEHCGEPQAWIVFNPSAVGIQGLANAYSGKSCFVSFTTASGANDDWLISPQLLGSKQTVSFYARAMHPSYLNEMLEIAVSFTGNDVDDFEETVETFRINSSAWRQYTVDLPAGTRYFAFHCISNEQFGLMIDDISYDPAQPPVELWGYNVYRDGECVVTEHPENSYVDTGASYNESHTYNVTAVYAQGESAYSNTVTTGNTSISLPDMSDADVAVTPVSGGVEVRGASGANLMVVTIGGQIVYNFRASDYERLSLAPGIYIVVAGDKRVKVIIR